MHKFILATVAFGVTCAALHQPALAITRGGNQLKSFISNTGNDGNTCADAADACATIGGALAKTAVDGEITILTPGDYSTAGVTISQAVTIDNGSQGEASIRNPGGGVGMTIQGGNGDMFILRGLTFEGDFTGGTGLAFSSGLGLQIEDCEFRNWQGNGAGVGLAFAPANNAQLFVSNSTFFNNGSGALSGGLSVGPTGTGSATVVLDHVHLDFNVEGLLLDTNLAGGGNGIHAVLRNGVASGNAGDGVSVLVPSGNPLAEVFIENSTMANNTGNGVVVSGQHAIAVLTGSKITRNGTGVSAVNGGQIVSRGDNTNNFNLGADGAATSFINPF